MVNTDGRKWDRTNSQQVVINIFENDIRNKAVWICSITQTGSVMQVPYSKNVQSGSMNAIVVEN